MIKMRRDWRTNCAKCAMKIMKMMSGDGAYVMCLI